MYLDSKTLVQAMNIFICLFNLLDQANLGTISSINWFWVSNITNLIKPEHNMILMFNVVV